MCMQTGNFEYFKDKDKTTRAPGSLLHCRTSASSDEDGWLFLRDRKTDMIISGARHLPGGDRERC